MNEQAQKRNRKSMALACNGCRAKRTKVTNSIRKHTGLSFASNMKILPSATASNRSVVPANIVEKRANTV